MKSDLAEREQWRGQEVELERLAKLAMRTGSDESQKDFSYLFDKVRSLFLILPFKFQANYC